MSLKINELIGCGWVLVVFVFVLSTRALLFWAIRYLPFAINCIYTSFFAAAVVVYFSLELTYMYVDMYVCISFFVDLFFSIILNHIKLIVLFNSFFNFFGHNTFISLFFCRSKLYFFWVDI